MRLIDADTLPKYTGYALSADAVAKAVDNAPTIDVVPIVRCKDCNFYRPVTNADRLRTMTDEELAEWINKHDCHTNLYGYDPKEAVLDWLKQEERRWH